MEKAWSLDFSLVDMNCYLLHLGFLSFVNNSDADAGHQHHVIADWLALILKKQCQKCLDLSIKERLT